MRGGKYGQSISQEVLKKFLWRLGQNIWPIRSNLLEKGIQLDPICPLCNEHPEDNKHLFMQCNAAKAVWFTSPLGIHIPCNALSA